MRIDRRQLHRGSAADGAMNNITPSGNSNSGNTAHNGNSGTPVAPITLHFALVITHMLKHSYVRDNCIYDMNATAKVVPYQT